MPRQWITDRAAMEAILCECTEGSLATVDADSAPYVVTVNYVFHEGKIVFHGALNGAKMDNIARDPRVCFEAHIVERIVRAPNAIEFGTRYRSVMVRGRARVLNDPQAKYDALMALTNRYAEGHPFEPPSEDDVEVTAVVAIDIDDMIGKRNVNR